MTIPQSTIEAITLAAFNRGVRYAIVGRENSSFDTQDDAVAEAAGNVRSILGRAGLILQRKRVAEVECPRGTDRWDREREKVQNYLPSNYEASCRIKDHGTEALACIRIEGYDLAGWTLDNYVIPRLASGLIVAKEIK